MVWDGLGRIPVYERQCYIRGIVLVNCYFWLVVWDSSVLHKV